MSVKLCFVEVLVDDLDRAIAWYDHVLGLCPSGPMVIDEKGRWMRLCSQDGGELVALWESPCKLDAVMKANANFIPIFHVEDLNGVVERIQKLGYAILKSIEDRENFRIITIVDCDDNHLQLIEFK